jgi:hypothetical protein
VHHNLRCSIRPCRPSCTPAIVTSTASMHTQALSPIQTPAPLLQVCHLHADVLGAAHNLAAACNMYTTLCEPSTTVESMPPAASSQLIRYQEPLRCAGTDVHPPHKKPWSSLLLDADNLCRDACSSAASDSLDDAD